jgi:hypothetical protein
MFCVHEAGFVGCPAIFERRRGRLGSKISGYGQLAEVAIYFAMFGFLHWRFAYAGPGARRATIMGRHPQTFTRADVVFRLEKH